MAIGLAIGNLAEKVSNKTKLREAGAVEPLRALVSSDDLALQRNGAFAVATLASKSKENREVMSSCGIIRLAIASAFEGGRRPGKCVTRRCETCCRRREQGSYSRRARNQPASCASATQPNATRSRRRTARIDSWSARATYAMQLDLAARGRCGDRVE